MSKHTPGPWETNEIDHDHPYQDIVIRNRKTRRTICKLWIDDAPVRDYNAEQELNAELIAAAPDLLDALRELLDFSIPDSHYRHKERAQQARNRASELLQRLDG